MVEALGYLGAVIAIAAGASVVMHFWHNLPASAELAFFGVVAVGLLATGAVLRTGDEPALGRLRSVLWLLSTISAASFVAVLADQIWHLSGGTVALLAEGAGTVYAIGLWWRTRATLQHLAVFAGAAALVATAINQVAPGTAAWVLVWESGSSRRCGASPSIAATWCRRRLASSPPGSACSEVRSR